MIDGAWIAKDPVVVFRAQQLFALLVGAPYRHFHAAEVIFSLDFSDAILKR
ncbi:hypothetical protein GP705_23845 [Escherichia coli]|nr:hypothetical protein GP705_23845 [Escherichia coli]